jgi:hypothetical protein
MRPAALLDPWRATSRGTPHRLGQAAESMPEERKVDALAGGGELAGDLARRMLGGQRYARIGHDRAVVTSR